MKELRKIESLKNQKGITLVALVITIIVLLILAAVSLNLVAGGNGIFGRATSSVDANKVSSAKEQAGLVLSDAVSAFYEDKYNGGNNVSGGSSMTFSAYIAAYVGADSRGTLDDGTLSVSGTTVTLQVVKSTGTVKFDATIDNSKNKVGAWGAETAVTP